MVCNHCTYEIGGWYRATPNGAVCEACRREIEAAEERFYFDGAYKYERPTAAASPPSVPSCKPE